LAPNVIAQELAPVADSVHRPARLVGGAAGAPPAGAAALGGLLEELLSHEKRSPPLQAASSAVEVKIRNVATRFVMKRG
jgi:hypothetical protein